MLEQLFDLQIWIGLATLVVLEIVLGIDNLIFIAILAEKLPPHQRDRARLIGLTLAVIMRLGLLTIVSWLVSLTQPIFSIAAWNFSGRDLILLLGGFFLIFKATIELHERIDGVNASSSSNKIYSSLTVVIAQIVVLDAVFSLDAVITAVGMVENLGVMMAAVIISMGVMLLAAKPLMRFVTTHPTVVILCLSFLLMIGFSLVADGLGFQIPKSYLYAAIGFSVLIEVFNQVLHFNTAKHEQRVPLRERTANKVLSLMASKNLNTELQKTSPPRPTSITDSAFAPEERTMVSGVLSLAERKVRSIMTPVSDIDWVNLHDDGDAIQKTLSSNPHSHLPVCTEKIDNLNGVAKAKDMLTDLLRYGKIQPQTIRRPVMMPEGAGVISLINELRHSKEHMVIVVNEFNAMSGIVTALDILEAIAGEFPDEDEGFSIQPVNDTPNTWIASGLADVHSVQHLLQTKELASSTDAFTTLGGLLTEMHGSLLHKGDTIILNGWLFSIIETKNGFLQQIKIEKLK